MANALTPAPFTDGFGLQDGTKLNRELANVISSVQTGITAATTQTLVAAIQLTARVSVLGTVANSGDAVKLPKAVAGRVAIVFNSGANPAKIFPQAATDTIDGGSAGAAVTLTNALRAIFICTAGGTWISAQLGVVSA